MARNTSKRRIVVDGAEYRWGVTPVGRMVVWEADGRRIIGRSDAPRISRNSTLFERPVGPFEAANWIRVNLHGSPAIARPRLPKPSATMRGALVAVAGPQPEAYVVVAEEGEHEDYGMTVLEVHLDPQIARESAAARDKAQALRRTLCEELFTPIFTEFERLRAVGAGDDEVGAAGRRIEEAFFRKHGIWDKKERDFIRNCPSGGGIPRHRVLPTRLLSSARMLVTG